MKIKVVKSGLKRRGIKKPVAKKKKRSKTKSYSTLLRLADANFSRYKRMSAADANGTAECFTCGHKNHWKKLQNGHYLSRFYKKYRFSENNTRVQCMMCNMWKSGDLATFRQKLLKEIGPELEKMESDYKELYKLTTDELDHIIQKYQALLKELN